MSEKGWAGKMASVAPVSQSGPVGRGTSRLSKFRAGTEPMAELHWPGVSVSMRGDPGRGNMPRRVVGPVAISAGPAWGPPLSRTGPSIMSGTFCSLVKMVKPQLVPLS